MFGDLNLDGCLNAADRALAHSLPADTGWCMPAASNAYRIVSLRTDVGLPGGAYTLSLSGDAGFRVWTTTPAIGEPLLVGGQTVTNGVGVTFLSGDDTDLFVEAVSNGTATLTYAFAGSNISCAASLKMTAFGVKPLLDTNRDGSVDESDEVGKNATVTFEGPKGAVILANADDDVNDQTAAPDCSDNVINGSADLPDIYPLKITGLGIPSSVIPDDFAVTLSVANPPEDSAGNPAANDRVRIFRSRTSTASGIIGSNPLTDSVTFRKNPGDGELNIALLAGMDGLELGVEGIAFGKQVVVTTTGYLGDVAVGSDSVRLLVSPFLALSNTDKATKCYLGPSWADFYSDTAAALDGVVPVEILGSTFVQDYGEIGYARAAPNQAQRKQTVIMGFDDLNQWYSGLVDPDTGYFLRANEQQRNPGGNIECSPALPSYPYGRLIVGANLAAPAREFFQAQKLQTDSSGSMIELPVSWLHVKHVDEVMTIIPVGSGFKVLVADLQLAIDLLRSNSTNETWGGYDTRAQILAAYDANSNRVAEICNYLAGVRSSLAQGLGVNESTFIKVPVAFTIALDGQVGSYLPNMVNMLVVKNASGVRRLVVPEPFFESFSAALLGELDSLGYQTGEAWFVDTSGPHSAGGETHCASNTRRETP